MKFGIISDTHGHELAWADAVSKFFGGAEMILHAGDVLYHGPRNPRKTDYNPAGLVERINTSNVPVVIARGNCDSSVDESCLDVPICAPYAFVKLSITRLNAGCCPSNAANCRSSAPSPIILTFEFRNPRN